MGYYIQVLDSSVTIKKENFDNCLKAIQGLHGKETISDASGKHFSWVDNEFYKINDLSSILKEWRWTPEFDDNGDISNLVFEGQKYGDDKIMFDAIAKFVESNSFIEFSGEDGARWKWIFNDNKCIELKEKITYYY